MTQDPRGCDASTLITLITYTWLSLVAREHPERTPGIPPLGDDNLIPSVPDSMALSLRTKATCYSTTGRRVTAQQATCRLVRPTPFRATPMPRRTNYLVPAGLPSNAEDKPSEQDQGGAPTPDRGEDGVVSQLPRDGRTSPMADDKRSVVEQMGAAPEGDKAVLGQAYQPTGEEAYKETPEQRYGSREAYEEAMEAAKDRSRKSEKQTGEGANFSEGSA